MPAVVLWLMVMVAVGGCASHPRAFAPSLDATIRERTLTQFDRAILLKPAAASRVSETIQHLAPLLMVDAPASLDGFSRLQVYHHANSVSLNGRHHAQFTFWWRTGTAAPSSTSRFAAQGVRLTLDANGRPVIWEVLSDPSEASVIYVAESLETRAAQEFGEPLAGCRFAIERSQADLPNGVLARVIADGPMPMGPIVHLRADLQEVTAVICRCMPAQVRELVGHAEYQLSAADFPNELTNRMGDLRSILRLPRDL